MSQNTETTPIFRIRHSLAHVLLMAIKHHFPHALPTIGPVTDTGFYYDIDFVDGLPDGKAGVKISVDDLKKVEDTMRDIIKRHLDFKVETIAPDQARGLFSVNPFKLEIIDSIRDKGEDVTIYRTGEDFFDLCEGPHVTNTKEIPLDGFTLTHIAGAYWRGDEKRPMLTRIYGLAFESKAELEAYILQQEEAKKRDHKIIGKQLGLFAFSDLVGKGLPMFLPKGAFVRDTLYQYIRDLKLKRGYSFVAIPHIAKRELYEKSGHMGKYDAMMPVMKDQNGDEYVMKAMNCPHHFELFNAEQHSYRDLPLRFAENTTCYRNEKSGELSGLLRVKSLTQDDTHHFVTEDQIESEIEMILGLMKEVYTNFNFKDFKVEVSVRDKAHPENYFGSDDLWNKAESKLIDIVKKWGADYSVEEGEAAFYGPKIDVRVKDSIGRDWQLTTVQLDFNQPQNFNLQYTDKDGTKKHVVVIHAAIFGSIERFMGVVIEHTAGNFPLWISPNQITILPITDKHHEYAKTVHAELINADIRAELDDSNEGLGKKIRNTRTMKTPYWAVIGDAEVTNGTVTLEHRTEGKIGEIKIAELVSKLAEEIKNKK